MTHEPPQEIDMYVDLESVFPGEPATSESLQEALATLSRDDALFFCARLNIQVSGHNLTLLPMDRQRHALGVLKPPPLIVERLDKFARDHNTREFSIFFRGQLLELAWRVAAGAKNLPGDGNTFEDEQVRLVFFKAALIASGLWGQRVFGDRLADSGAHSEQLRRALGAFRKGVEESNATLDAGIALGRAWLLFGTHLPHRYTGFGDAFEKTTGVTLKQYFVCAFWLLRYSFPDAPNGGIFDSRIGANHAEWGSIFSTFLGKISQDPKSLATSIGDNDQTGYRSLRERPVLSFPGSRSIILDPVFYTDAITTSPLFHAMQAVHPPIALFTAFGDAFEDYALDLLNSRYEGMKRLPGEILRPRMHGRTGAGEEFEADAILNFAPTLFVLEMKASFIREDTILTQNAEDFLQELRRKYGYVTGSGERPKGVAQLAKIVGAIARGEWTGETQEFASTSEIYPILTVHDEKLGAPGLASFLDDEFWTLLGEIPSGVRVHSLIVLTISDLEALTSPETSIELVTFLRDYARETPERVRSIHNFAAIRPEYSENWSRHPKLRAAFDDLLQATRLELFPPKTTP